MTNEAFNICCKDYLRLRRRFNLIVADPPYFKGPETRRYYGNTYSKKNIKRRDYDIIEDWNVPDMEWFLMVKMACDILIIWGANYYDFIGPVHLTPRKKDLEVWLAEHPIGWIVWDKCNGSSSYNDYELAWTNIDTPTVIYKFMWNGMNQGKNIFEGHIMQGNKKLNEIRIHCTQKPTFLYKWIYYTYAKPGYTILDTHLGSGSSRIAAWDMNYDFYGCEKDKTIFIKQEKRFEKHKLKSINQTKLFI